MFSIGLKMTVRPGCYDEYKNAHDTLWTEIAEGMAANNVSMAIFRFGNELVVYAVAPTEEDWKKSRQDPSLDRWHEYMAKLIVTDDTGQITFEQGEKAFLFGLFKS